MKGTTRSPKPRLLPDGRLPQSKRHTSCRRWTPHHCLRPPQPIFAHLGKTSETAASNALTPPEKRARRPLASASTGRDSALPLKAPLLKRETAAPPLQLLALLEVTPSRKYGQWLGLETCEGRAGKRQVRVIDILHGGDSYRRGVWTVVPACTIEESRPAKTNTTLVARVRARCSPSLVHAK